MAFLSSILRKEPPQASPPARRVVGAHPALAPAPTDAADAPSSVIQLPSRTPATAPAVEDEAIGSRVARFPITMAGVTFASSQEVETQIGLAKALNFKRIIN